MRKACGPDTCQVLRLDRVALSFQARDDLLHLDRVVVDHNVAEQVQTAHLMGKLLICLGADLALLSKGELGT